MIIYGYDITLSVATFLLAVFTAASALFIAASAFFTAVAASHKKNLAKYNKDLVSQNEKQHREALRPLCLPTTTTGAAIEHFNMVIGPYNTLFRHVNLAIQTNGNPAIHLQFVNKGIGPAVNVRFHINNIKRQRITKDFLVTHALPPGDTCIFLSEIPGLDIRDSDGILFLGMPPRQVDHDAYFIICEYESIFSGDAFHSTVAKGYLDPALAGDGKNQWRLNRPLTPPVEFRPGLDPSKPIWPLPPEDADYPGAFLNFPQSEKGQSK